MNFTEPKPLTDVLAHLDAKTPLGSAMRSADWQAAPQELRDGAFFSAGVTEARFIAQQKQAIRDMIARARETNAAGQSMWKMDRGQFIAQLRQMGEAMGVKHPDGRKGGVNEKDITDPISIARLKLVVNTQLDLAYGYGQYLTAMDPDLISEWPAWELVRITPRKAPRNWLQRWADAGGVLHDGRMIALKTDPIWSKISRFGKPHPPFDYNSGMGVEEIDVDTADALGVMQGKSAAVKAPPVEGFTDGLQADVKDLSPVIKTRLSKVAGTKIKLEGDTAHAQTKNGPAQPPPGAGSKGPLQLRKQTQQDAAHAFEKEFGCKVVFKSPPGSYDWGAELTEKDAIKHLQTVAGEWHRLRSEYKALQTPGSIHTFICVHSSTGLGHIDGSEPWCAVKAKEWAANEWLAVADWEHVNKRKWSAERRGSQVVDNFRHELGHNLSTPAIMDAFRRVVMSHYDLEWFRQNVSDYAASNAEEAVAEAFAIATRTDYVPGTLPAVLEKFILETMLGGKI